MRRVLLIFAVWTPFLLAAAPLGPWNGVLLDQLRTDYRAGQAETVSYVKRMESAAEKYLQMESLTVTAKQKLPPSLDPRDYMTLSPYWWPDPDKEDGLPYVRRDGQRNPEVYDYPDRENADLMGDAVLCLGQLYYITGKEAYAKTAARLLKAWFLDGKTGMNPNMTYAQCVPGMEKMRGTGIIDSRRFTRALAASRLIEGSKSWTSADQEALNDWASAFCYWLEHSTQGRQEAKAKNNHGLWYEAIHLMVLACLDRPDRIREVVEQNILPKIDAQVAADGSLPQELKRTLSLHYSTFVLEAIVEADYVTAPLGISLWQATTKGGHSIAQAVDYLLPYYLSPETWPYQQINEFKTARAAVVLYEAGSSLNRQDLLDAAYEIGLKRGSKDVDRMLYMKLKNK